MATASKQILCETNSSITFASWEVENQLCDDFSLSRFEAKNWTTCQTILQFVLWLVIFNDIQSQDKRSEKKRKTVFSANT